MWSDLQKEHLCLEEKQEGLDRDPLVVFMQPTEESPAPDRGSKLNLNGSSLIFCMFEAFL